MKDLFGKSDQICSFLILSQREDTRVKKYFSHSTSYALICELLL